ncbi:hypothetical protein M426DRAFT_320418 [Hypoxylon sp. CI-4A]|nr:hypothetical protein M426DRAFT_320418 [Hypoxylon sp. CI-4A]
MWIDGTKKQDNTGDGQIGEESVTAKTQRLMQSIFDEDEHKYVSPLAAYMARMLHWHQTSNDLIRYATTKPQPKATADAEENTRPDTKTLEPAAIIADGYSLTISEQYATRMHVEDAYQADDHWQWLATLWRGVVGADLTIYVKQIGYGKDAGINVHNNRTPPQCIMVLDLPPLGPGGMEGGLERRIGFELMEWIHNASYKADPPKAESR